MRNTIFTLVFSLTLLGSVCYGNAEEGNMAQSSSAGAASSEVQLIPREVLFGNPKNVAPKLSPDGRYIAYIAPDEGVLNIWLRTVGLEDDRPITHDRGRGIFSHAWAYNGEQVVYTQDRDGDENHRVFAVNIATGETAELTPEDPNVAHKVQAQFIGAIPERPDEALIGLNKRDERMHDAYLLNLRTGEMTLKEQATPDLLGWLVDHELRIRGYVATRPDGGSVIMLRDGDSGPFSPTLEFDPVDFFTSGPVDFTPENQGLFLKDSRGRNAAALVQVGLDGDEPQVIASDPTYDVGSVLLHPTRHTVEAVSFNRDKVEWQAINPELSDDFARLRELGDGNIGIVSRTLDDSRWLVALAEDDGPVAYYTYDRATGSAELLFHHRPELLDYQLAQMQPVSFTSRDGLTIHGYVTLPLNWQAPGPLVLNVHGGPWGRDSWGYNPEAQWLANRGYACLQVNFRGSTGYGKQFVNAGDREWGGKMQDDLTDAVQWAIQQGIADPEQVVIYGGSYGGYATLAGVTFTPEVYAGGISIVGPSSMETFLNTIPPYWEAFRKQMDDRVGRIPRYADGPMAGMPKNEADLTDEERAEIEFMRSRSPLYHVDKVRVPMLIAQGANDPRVKKAESDQFAAALEEKGLKVEYVVYEDEGHGFARPENRLDFYRRSEKFLAEVLGGRYEE